MDGRRDPPMSYLYLIPLSPIPIHTSSPLSCYIYISDQTKKETDIIKAAIGSVSGLVNGISLLNGRQGRTTSCQ